MPFYSETSNVYLIIFFIACLWEVLLLSGITYGWASIVVVFKQKGFFLDLCHGNHSEPAYMISDREPHFNNTIVQMGSVYIGPNDTGCKDQNERLNLIFTIAVVFLCCVKFPVGIFLDAFGPRLTRVLGCVMYAISCLGLAFTEPGYGNILFPVFILMCGGGSLNVLSLYQVCNIVFRNAKSLVLCILHGAFDSSAVILLLFKLGYDAGIRLRDISLFYGALCVLTVVLSTSFMIPSRQHLLTWNQSEKYDPADAEAILEEKGEHFASNSLQGVTFVCSGSQGDPRHRLIVYKPSEGEKSSWKQASFVKYGTAEENDNVECDDKKPILVNGSQPSALSAQGEFRVPETIWKCVFSPAYLLELVYLSFVQLKLWFFVGSLNQYLEVLTNKDPSLVSYYVDTFGYVQLCGVVVTPFIGAIFDQSIFLGKVSGPKYSSAGERISKMKGAVLPLVITSLLNLLFCVLSLVRSLKVMIPCFVLYTVVRGFMYSNHGAYIGIAFPADYFGRLYGLGVFTAGIFGLLQYVLFVITTNYMGQDPYWMNVLVLILAIGTNALPIYVYSYCKRAIGEGVLEAVKKDVEEESSNL